MVQVYVPGSRSLTVSDVSSKAFGVPSAGSGVRPVAGDVRASWHRPPAGSPKRSGSSAGCCGSCASRSMRPGAARRVVNDNRCALPGPSVVADGDGLGDRVAPEQQVVEAHLPVRVGHLRGAVDRDGHALHWAGRFRYPGPSQVFVTLIAPRCRGSTNVRLIVGSAWSGVTSRAGRPRCRSQMASSSRRPSTRPGGTAAIVHLPVRPSVGARRVVIVSSAPALRRSYTGALSV